MLCLHCGKELKDGTKFCPFCGAVVGAGSTAQPFAGPAANGGAAAPGKPKGGKNHRRDLFIIGGAAAVAIAAVALIIAVVMGAFRSPKEQLGFALAQTFSAYSGIGDKLDLPELKTLSEKRSMSQSLSLTLDSFNGDLIGIGYASALEGLGLRMDTDYDHGDRKLDCDLAVFDGDEDLASVQLLVDNNNLYLASHQFTKGDAYGLNTETLGADLYRIAEEGDGTPDPDLEKISFNLFDLIDIAAAEDQRAEARQDMKDAVMKLIEAVTVKKTGNKTVQVNGKNIEATAYQVVIPERDLKDFISAMEDALEAVDAEDTLKAVLEAMGLPKSRVKEIVAGMESADRYGEMADRLKELVKELGDLELEVYVSDGYLSAVEYSGRVDGEKVEFGLYLGGGSEYVDDLSLELTVDGRKLTLESSGDHGAKNGVFTDKTKLRLRDGMSDTRLNSELRYEVEGGGFEWELEGNSAVRLELEGRLATAKDSLEIQGGMLTLRAMGTKVLGLELNYSIGPCDGMRVSASAPTMLSNMDWDDLQDLTGDIRGNVTAWVRDLVTRRLLGSFFR